MVPGRVVCVPGPWLGRVSLSLIGHCVSLVTGWVLCVPGYRFGLCISVLGWVVFPRSLVRLCVSKVPGWVVCVKGPWLGRVCPRSLVGFCVSKVPG